MHAKLAEGALNCQKALDRSGANLLKGAKYNAYLPAEVHISLEFQGAGCDAVKALATSAESIVKVSTVPEVAQQFRFAGMGQ